MKVEDKSEKDDLKLKIQKTKITAFCPITSWQKDRETMETVTDFIYLGSKLSADGDCSHEMKRCLLLEEKLWLTQVQSLGREDPLQKGMAIPSTLLA